MDTFLLIEKSNICCSSKTNNYTAQCNDTHKKYKPTLYVARLKLLIQYNQEKKLQKFISHQNEKFFIYELYFKRVHQGEVIKSFTLDILLQYFIIDEWGFPCIFDIIIFLLYCNSNDTPIYI